MEYKEGEILQVLENDIQHPECLFEKEYIAEHGITGDTGKSYEEIILSFLLTHEKDLKEAARFRTMYHTVIEKVSNNGNRQLDGILAQKEFARGKAWDRKILLEDSGHRIWGTFSFFCTDREGKRVTLFDMRPEVEEETTLHRMLRLWSWKESIDPGVVGKVIGVEKPLDIRGVTLFIGVSNARYGLSKKTAKPAAMQRLGMILGVSELYLFHGFYLSPVNRGLPAEGQYTRAEIISALEKDSIHPETLYQKDYVNRAGAASDTGEPYSWIIGEWLLAHRDIWMSLPRATHHLMEGSRGDMLLKDERLLQVKKQKVLPPFGRVLPVNIAFLGSRAQQTEKPAVLLHDLQGDGFSMIRILEIPETGESLLGTVLRIFTHLAAVNIQKLMRELKLPENTQMEGRILLDPHGRNTDEFLRDFNGLSELMKAMSIGLVIMKNGYEALW